MRKLIATVFNYSLDGLLADEGTEFWKFCFGLPEIREPDDPAHLGFLQSAYAHIMGRTAYEAIARAMTTATDHPFADILNAARKVVFSRTLKTAEWASTTIAAGDTTEEIDKLRQGGDGHIVVWGGVSLWRSLMRLDLIDELQLSLFPYVAGQGTRLFDGVPKSCQLNLVSSTASGNGIIELQIGGLWADRTVGLDGVRSDIAMMRTPDGHSKLELTKYDAPAADGAEPQNPPPNTLGLHRVMFAVDDIHDTVARLRAHGAELLGEVAQYESIFLLCYLRGPAGIIVALAEQIG